MGAGVFIAPELVIGIEDDCPAARSGDDVRGVLFARLCAFCFAFRFIPANIVLIGGGKEAERVRGQVVYLTILWRAVSRQSSRSFRGMPNQQEMVA